MFYPIFGSNGKSLEEEALCTSRIISVHSSTDNRCIISGRLNLTQCHGQRDGKRCTSRGMLPYCATHCVEYHSVLPDLEFGGLGLYAVNLQRDAHDVVFETNTNILCYNRMTTIYKPSGNKYIKIQPPGSTPIYSWITCDVTSKVEVDKIWGDNVVPYCITDTNLTCYDTLFTRSVASLANTQEKSNCNAEFREGISPITKETCIYISAIKPIHNFEPIHVYYGKEYLAAIRKNDLSRIIYDPPLDPGLMAANTLYGRFVL